MDQRSRTITFLPLILTLSAVILVVIAIQLWPKRRYLLACEYWVYVEKPEIPKMEAVMTRMISENPFIRRGHAPIAAREGLLFSDIRLDVTLVRRAKNAHLFRPDVTDGAEAISPDALAALGPCDAFFRLAYISSRPTADLRHLTFMPHLAAAYADLVRGVVITDPILGESWTHESFSDSIRQAPNLEAAGFHVKVVWIPDGSAGYHMSKGLRKAGWSELQSLPVSADQRTTVEGLMNLLVRELWNRSPRVAGIEPTSIDLQTEFSSYRAALRRSRDVILVEFLQVTQ